MTFIANKIRLMFEGVFRKKKVPSGVVDSCWRSNITIGERVSFGGNVLLAGSGPITIGNDTMIAPNVVIHTATHDYDVHPMWTWCIERPVEIGNHVWIGTSAIILPGVKIEDYAVVGAGSVVTKHVPSAAVVMGNPARIVKYRKTDIISQQIDINKYPGELKREPLLSSDRKCKLK